MTSTIYWLCRNPGLIIAATIAFGSFMTAGCMNIETQGTDTLSPSSIWTTPTDSGSTLPSWGGLVIPAPDEAGPAEIWLDDYESRPNVLTVETGTTVTWINYDNGKPLTLISDDNLFAVEIGPPMGKFSYLFENPGTFGYSVDPYSEVWQGAVIVVDKTVD